LGYRNLDKLREKLAPIFLRRTRSEVLSQLPPRTDTTIFVEMTDSQRGPYTEQQYVLARLVHKPYLTEIDRRRILCCIANMRMLCDSTFLFDKQTNVSPKLEELAELLPEVLASGPHKAVIFSQWEMMLRKTAELLDRLRIGYTILHGGVPTKQRRELLDRFRTDPKCKVFLSTDAGGTGLNLQAADTVINLEVPWNPAVLEQRIARVHRLGQQQTVQVINLVTRNSIEERVLKTVELKRSLFDGLFAGGTDEVSFAALGRSAFLETVREMVEEPRRPAPPPVPAPAVTDPRQAFVLAGVQLLEALAGMVATSNGQPAIRVTSDAQTGQPVLQLPLPPPEVLERGAVALQTLLKEFGRPQEE
jgi:SNF2 family DNA or RNA helicase